MATRDSPERHTCHCGKSFLRKEHLKRHQATHGERSYTCHICNRSFTRNDLLRRHTNVHESAAVPEARRARACDACHDNKTKCDGGARCSLCSKRGIDCTYDRPATTSALNNPLSNNQHGEVSVTQATLPDRRRSLEMRNTAAAESLRMDIDHASGSASSPSGSNSSSQSTRRDNAVHRETENSITRLGLQSLVKAIFLARSGSSRWRAPLESGELQGWTTSMLESYFGHFHTRWPVVHAPTFDEDDEPPLKALSIFMIGAWFSELGTSKELVLQVHDLLVNQCFEEMTMSKMTLDTTKPWPFETYQAIILNIIFAFETGSERLIARARILHGLFVATLREDGVFSFEAVEHQRVTYFPGDFIPWVHMTYERWSRLATWAFIVDTYLSLSSGQPPVMHREELDLGLVSTCSMWNAHGLHVFPKRYQVEPHDRRSYKISMLAKGHVPSLPCGILIEDVQVGLCGVRQSVWNYAQARVIDADQPHVDPETQLTLSQQLDMWKLELDRLSALCSESTAHPERDLLLKFYAMKEELDNDDDIGPIIDRIDIAIFNATMLYHLLSLHLYADMQVLGIVVTGPSTLWNNHQILSPKDTGKQVLLYQWSNTSDSRISLLHSLSILQAYEKIKTKSGLRKGSLDPITYMALSASALVVCALLLTTKDRCTCVPGLGHIDIGLEPFVIGHGSDMTNWINNGGTIDLGGIPICKCALALWIARFVTALTDEGRRWKMGATVAHALQSKLAST